MCLQEKNKANVIYADLLDDAGIAVLRQKLLPHDGTAIGSFVLPHDSLITINALRVYTRKMLESEVPHVCMIPIIRNQPNVASCIVVKRTERIDRALKACKLSIEGEVCSVGKHRVTSGIVVCAELGHPLNNHLISLRDTIEEDGQFCLPVPDVYGTRNLSIWCENKGKVTTLYRPLLRRHLIPSKLPDSSDTLRTSYFVDIASLIDSIYAIGGKFPASAKWIISQPRIRREFRERHRAMGWNGVAYSLYPSRKLTYRNKGIKYRVFHTFKTGQVSAYRGVSGDLSLSGSDIQSINKSIYLKSYKEEGAPDIDLNDVEWAIIDLSEGQGDLLPPFRREKLTPFRPFNVWFGYSRLSTKQAKGVRFTSFESFAM